jgi:hypothetical protein
MSTATAEKKLNELILSGKILEAFEEFYAEDVQMRENNEPPRVGKATNREYEQKFVAAIEAFHGVKLVAHAVEGDVSFSEWDYDFTLKGLPRLTYSQVTVRRWQHGKIVDERFYYNRG